MTETSTRLASVRSPFLQLPGHVGLAADRMTADAALVGLAPKPGEVERPRTSATVPARAPRA